MGGTVSQNHQDSDGGMAGPTMYYRVPQVRNQDEPLGTGESNPGSSGNGNDDMDKEDVLGDADGAEPDEFDIILEEQEQGVKRRHIARAFDRFTKTGRVEFDFGETGPICMGTDSKLSMMVQLASSECRFLGDEEGEDESDGGMDDMFRTGRNDAPACKETERTARKVRMRNCMMEVLEWSDGEGRVNMTAVGEVMGGTRMGERFVAEHMQSVAGCAKKAYQVVEQYRDGLQDVAKEKERK